MAVSTARKHVHDQTVAATVWTVVHNLSTTAPSIDVYINTGSGLQKIFPEDITVVDANTLKITFSSARTGTASVI